MKPSYFQSPRTLSDCHFSFSADPIERPDRTNSLGHAVVAWVSAIGLVGVSFYLALGG